MAQIAQQDNLYIQISGTLKTNYGKVLGYEVDTTAANAPKYTIAVMDVNTGMAKSIELN